MAGRWLRNLLMAAGVLLTAPAAASELARVTGSRALPDGIELSAGAGTLRITALTDSILRVQAVPEGALPPDASWAVLPEWRSRAAPVRPEPLGFATGALRVAVTPDPLALTITDAAGDRLLQSAPGRPIAFRDGGFEGWQQLPADEAVFGLGDKTGALDRRGRAFVNWNTDAVGYGDASDPLYKTVPFLLRLRQGVASGLFLDNTWRSHFDIGMTRADALGFGADGGPLDLYVLAGPDPKQVLERYTALTGRMKLPPLWALGFQQSRWSYPTQARVLEVAANYRAAAIPLDVIWLDIGYQDANRPFTVDPRAFPDLPAMTHALGMLGVKVVAITDLHIARVPGTAPFDSGMAGDHFVKNPDGTPYVGDVWPGPAVFPDFSRADTQRWWGGLYRDFALKDGVAGFWNDMNEPTVFDGPAKSFPLDVLHRIDAPGEPPRTASHRELHNVYGMLNAQATAEGLRALAPDRRPFVLTRASFAGGQRSAAVWTGDNSSTWEHLRLSTPQLLSLGLSGFALAGDDIGGFSGSPTPELLTRWIQVGAFNPLFRDHTEAGSRDQEAYVGDAAQVDLRRAAIAARYRLIPYLYTAAEEASRNGMPIMRPLFLEYPAAGLERVDQEFLFGRDLLVAPPPENRPDGFELVLPPGTAWFDYWTGLRLAGKGAAPRADRIPVLARAGAIIPHQPLTQSTAETPRGNLELRVYPGPDCAGAVYADDGLTLAYQSGGFLRQAFGCREEADGWHVTLAAPEGDFRPWWSAIDLVLFGQTAAPGAVRRGGVTVPATYDPISESVRVTLPAGAAEIVFARGG